MKPRSQRTMRMTIMVQSIEYIFPLSLFKRRIPTDSREIIKQKLDHQGGDALRLGGPRKILSVRRSKSQRSTSFGRNSFSNVFDLLFDFAYLRMYVANQIVLGSRKLFNAGCHFMKLFQRRMLMG